MKNFQHGQTVFVFYKGAGYEATYKAVDTFDKNKPHKVQIQSMNRELSFSDDDVFHSFSELRKNYPQVNSSI